MSDFGALLLFMGFCILIGYLYRIKMERPDPPEFKVTMTEIENAVGDTDEERTIGVAELFREKGFTVDGPRR